MLDKIFTFFQYLGTAFGTTGTTATVLRTITGIINAASLVVGVKGFLQARNMLAKGQDILLNKTSTGGKIPVIYGTRRVGAQIIYMDVNANDSRDLYVVYALSVGECDEILGKTIELDGNPLTDSARFRDGGYIGSDKISSGAGSLNTVSQNGTGIDAGAGQFGTSPTSKYRYVMNLHHGAASQTADPMLVASMPNWTSAHKLNGICYIAAHYGYDKEGIWSGVPQLTVQVRGKKVYDPRLDSTAGGSGSHRFNDVSTYAYSDNPALCFLDYITNDEYGKGLTSSQINMSTFSSAANVCDTQVDQPYFDGTAQSLTWSANSGDDFFTISGASANTQWFQNKLGELLDLFDSNGNGVLDEVEIKAIRRSQYFDTNKEFLVFVNFLFTTDYSTQTGTSLLKVKRFHCNGYVDTNKNVMDNAKELLANMRGIFLYVDGKYELSIEDTGTSTFSITDDHIIADAGISVDYGNKDKKANKVIVEFFNANKKYELDTATVLHDASPEYYSDDNDEILEIKAEFPYVSDPYIAYNMGKAILVRSRNQTTMQFLGTPEMYKLNVGDIVDLTYAGLGFSGKVCRVEALELQSNGLVAVSLIEYFDVYTWEVPPQEPVEELANLPSAYAVKPPTGITFTDTNSSAIDRPFISWSQITDFPSSEFRLDLENSSGDIVFSKIVDTNSVDLSFIPTGDYVANITSINSLGVESDPARFPSSGTFTVSDAPVALGDIQANAITANEINVTNLAAISADLGAITAGSMNIGSGAFTVSSAGVMTATGATISGNLTADTLNVTDATITGTFDASAITVDGEPLDNLISYSEVGGIGLLSLNETSDFVGDVLFEGDVQLKGLQTDLVIGKTDNAVSSEDTIAADLILRSNNALNSIRIQNDNNTNIFQINVDLFTTDITSANKDLEIKTSTSNDLIFKTNNQSAMYIDDGQRVMIGVSTNTNIAANADDLIVGNNTQSGETGITLGSTTASTVRFNDGSDSGSIEYSHSTNAMRFSTNGAVALTLDSSGNLTATGNVTAYSDERLKTDIETLDAKKTLQMRGVSFIKDGKKGSGVIAQEIEAIAPELVITADDEQGTKSVAYGNLVGYLIETVKYQQEQIDALNKRLDNDIS